MTTAGSFCTGYGGLDIAVEAAFGPVRHAWHAEIDPDASKLGAARFPGVPNLGDLRAVDWTTVDPVDVLTAGFPCQPVSSAGRRKGVDDERWLWDDIATAVGRMGTRPRMLVLENVAGLLTANRGDALARVVRGLAALGYVGRYRLLRASDVGAAHRRERWFCVARLADSDRGGLRPNLSDVRAGEPDPVGRGELSLLPTPTAGHTARNATSSRPEGSRHHDGWTLGDIAHANRWGEYGAAIARWEHVTGRPAPEPTETGTKGQPRLAPAFVEWLMGLPAGWVTDLLPRNAALRVLGNGVVWQQAAAAIRELAA